MCTTASGLFVEMGVSWTFLTRLASNFNPSDLYLPGSWDYRYEPLSLVSVLLTSACFIK
jgi:hypothetical protein